MTELQRRDCKHNDNGICKRYCVETEYDLRSRRYVPCGVVRQYIPNCKYECRFTQEELAAFIKQLEAMPELQRNDLKWGERHYGE